MSPINALFSRTDSPQTEPNLTASIRRVEGEVETLVVPMATEPWRVTAAQLAEVTARQGHRRGYFPGFEGTKRQANQRRRERLTSPLLPSPLEPVPLLSTQGIVFDGPGESDTIYIPPDPIIAAGPNHLVVAINSLIAIYSKAGVRQGNYQQLSSFFGALGIVGRVFDPRVIYDQLNQRFILTAAEIDLTNFTTGRVLLAVSQTADPTGLWYKFALDFKGRNLAGDADTFPDFPTLGLSSTAVYISTAQFVVTAACREGQYCSFSDTWIMVIGLPELLAGDPALRITTFKDVRAASGEPAFTIQPAVTYGNSTQEFLVAASFASNPGTKLNIYAVNTSGTPTLSSVDLPVPSFWFPPDALQPNSYRGIATNDFRLLNAVWANGSLWCAHNVGDDTDFTAAARWYEINAANLASVSLRQSGTIKGSGHAYYPAVAVKPNGDAGVALSTSSRFQFPSAAFTGRASTDPLGAMRAPVIYREGTSSYEDIALRWGDYSGASPDPDGGSFWLIAEYAGSPNPHFGTAIAQFSGPPTFNFSSTRLDFGNQTVNFPSAPQTVTVTNLDPDTVTLGDLVLTGPYAAEFALSSDGCSQVTLNPGSTCNVSVVFTPSDVGVRTALLSFDAGPSSSRQAVFLIGTGVANVGGLIVSPDALTFPDTPLRTPSVPRTVTITNTGTVDYVVWSIHATSDFASKTDCGDRISPGQSCTATVRFWPTYEGSHYGNLTILAPVQGGSALPTATLVGNGITAPAATLCPTSMGFPNQAVGTTSSAQTITINNSGSAPMTVSALSLAGDFALTHSCGSFPITLPARKACTLNVTFSPTTTGTRTGTLTVTDDASGSPYQVTLTGTGISAPALVNPRAALMMPEIAESRPNAPTSEGTESKLSVNAQHAYGKLPLSFEANLGQTDSEVRFLSRGQGYMLFLTDAEVVLALRNPPVSNRPAADRNRRVEDPKTTVIGSDQSSGGSGTSEATPGTLGDGLPARESTPLGDRHAPIENSPAVIRLKLVDANQQATVTGVGELPGKTHYFRSNDSSQWQTNVPSYAKVRYENVYPGIDLVYYGNQQQLEYDFVVAPGADPNLIRLELVGEGSALPRAAGGRPYQIDPNGDLVISTDAGEMRFHKPVVYQEQASVVGGQSSVVSPQSGRTTGNGPQTTDNRQFLDGRYVLRAHNPKSTIKNPKYEVAFELAAYDRSLPLIIDPVLEYSTYLGGGALDVASGIAVDAAGNAYVVGVTSSADFPTAQPLQSAINRIYEYATDAFVTKLSPDGTFFVFSTFFGGSEGEAATAVALDSSGNAFVAGVTGSSDLPVTPNAYQKFIRASESFGGDAFVAKFNPDGSALLYSTFLGGTGSEENPKIAVDASGSAYVAGTTYSLDFPVTPGAFQSVYGSRCSANRSCGDGFIAKLAPDGSSLSYSTYLGGSGEDTLKDIAVDSLGQVHVTGYTLSRDFPTTPGAFQIGHARARVNAFLAKLNSQGTQLLYSSYLGGDGNPDFSSPTGDQGLGVAVDSYGNVYVAGTTISVDFPTTHAIPPVLLGFAGNPFSDVFVAKFHPAGCALSYTTLIGGYWSEWGEGIAVDSSGNAYVTGGTTSPDFPTANPLQASCSTFFGVHTIGCPFALKLDPTGSSLIYSTFVGGSDSESFWCCNKANAIAIDSAENAYIAGETRSSDFPIVNALRSRYGGQTDGFVAKMSPTNPPTLAIDPPRLTFPDQLVGTTSAPLNVTLTNQTSNTIALRSITGAYQVAVDHNCPSSLAPAASCTLSVRFTPAYAGLQYNLVTIDDDAFAGPHIVVAYCNGYRGPGVSFYPPPGSDIAVAWTPVGTTRTYPDRVEVRSSGDRDLEILGMTTSQEFSYTTNCPTRLAPNSTCTVSLGFTPQASGVRTGTLTITDSAPDSPHSFSIYGVGQDFALSSSASEATITAGGTKSFALTVDAPNGFNGDLSLSCGGAPARSTCSVSPSSISMNGSYSATATLTVRTTARSVAWRMLPPSILAKNKKVLDLGALFLSALALLSVLPGRSRRRARLALALTLATLLVWAACGGGTAGGGGGGGGGGGSGGTPAGTYTITVTATSGSLSHTLQVALTVK